MANEFEAAIEEAKRLEGKIVAYAPYSGEIKIEKTLEFDPKEYIDYTYQDLLNTYERDQKIISTASMMGMLAGGGETTPETAPEPSSVTLAPEIEINIKKMTTETLQKADEVAKEPAISGPDIFIGPETTQPEQNKILFELREATEIKHEVKKEEPKPEITIPELDKVEVPETEPEQIEIPEPEPKQVEIPELEIQTEKKVIVANVPPALSEPHNEAALERYGLMEEQIRSALGDKNDELTLKKKMLDLTKQLFKEKTTTKREELKLQITVLKNMLVTAQTGSTGKAKKKKDDSTYSRLLDTMIITQQSEISQTKDSIVDSYKKQIGEIKKKFYDELHKVDDQTEKKKILESFVFSITSLAEQLPEVIEKYKEFSTKKHCSELEKIRDSLEPNEKAVLSKVNERLEYVANEYGKEFSSVKGIVGKEIENLIDNAGTEVFTKPDDKQKDDKDRTQEIVNEINETDEGTLLYYLHSKELEYYREYEHKKVSKSEAILKAKELMALEKGLSDNTVRKYFSQKED